MSDQGGTGGGPPPGWYPDPERADQQRWWNGSRWTDHTAPRQPPPPGGGGPGSSWGTPPAGSWGGPTRGPQWGAPYGGAGPRQVQTWLWQSIAVTLLCCMPLGVVGIVFAAQAQGALNAGDIAEAQRKADTARTFAIAGFVIGLVLIPFVFLAGV